MDCRCEFREHDDCGLRRPGESGNPGDGADYGRSNGNRLHNR